MLKNLFFTATELTNLKNTTDKRLKQRIQDVLETADNTSSLIHLGFVYHYTGDNAHLEHAKAVMFQKVDKESWISPGYDPQKYYGFDIRTALETGDRCIEMAYGLSLFGNALSDDDRTYLIRKTYERGILPIMEDWVLPNKRIHALDTMGHNFWITIISAAALALTVLQDYVPDGNALLDAAIYAAKSWFLYKGNPMNAKPQTIDGGGYYEGVSYFDFSIHEYLKFAIAYKRLTGRHPFDDEQLLTDAGNFFLNTCYTSDKRDYFSAFGDSGADNAYQSSPMYLILYGMGTPGLRWFVQTRLEQQNEKIIRLLTWDEIYTQPAYAPDTLSVCYDKIGWAIFKDGWEKGSTMLAVKCGDTWNHAHADAGHFILFHSGVPEIYDSMTADSYSNPLYIDYYVESIAHNVVLFNGQGQDVRDNYKNHAHMPGRLLNFTDNDGFRYVAADTTGPMGRWFRKHHRHFLWLDGFILIYDDIECYETGEVNFLIHAKENHCFRMLSPHSIEEKTGHKPPKGEKIPYWSYNTRTDDEGHAKFAGVMLLDDTLTPEFTEIEHGWKIIVGNTTVYINHRADGKVMHRNCINIMDGITTDAEILVCKDDRYAVANGSIVRRNGISYLDTLARITGWTDPALR